MDDSRYSVVHQGRVEEVRGSTARVSVVVEDGARSCAGCVLVHKCGSNTSGSDKAGMVVEAFIPAGFVSSVSEGGTVSIGARKNTVLTSILLLVVLPLASMICVMAVCLAAGLGDGAAGGAGLVAIALAFAALFIWGKKVSRRPVWIIIE